MKEEVNNSNNKKESRKERFKKFCKENVKKAVIITVGAAAVAVAGVACYKGYNKAYNKKKGQDQDTTNEEPGGLMLFTVDAVKPVTPKYPTHNSLEQTSRSWARRDNERNTGFGNKYNHRYYDPSTGRSVRHGRNN